MKAEVFNIKKFSLHDGPGIRTTVFLRGCPLNCWWCHNPESFREFDETKGCTPAKIKLYSGVELFEELYKDLPFYEESGGGVTFSGGEPLLHSRFLSSILNKLHETDIHSAIDTSGYIEPEKFIQLAKKTDLVLFDLKVADPAEHKKYTGVSNELIHQNFFQLYKNMINTFVRIPLIPGITDNEVNLLKLKELIIQNKAVKQVDLLPYNEFADSKYKRLNMNHQIMGLKKQSDEKLEYIKNIFSNLPVKVTLRG